MRKLKLLLTMLVLLVGGGLSANAQGWTAPAIPGVDISTTNTGNFAIYNIKADAFMGEGMNYSTMAIVCRLEGGYSAALAARQKFTLTVAGSTVKMVHVNHTNRGVGCASTNANNIYADYESNNVWTFASSANYSNAYTLTIDGYGTLDVDDRWGGKLTIKDGEGYTDWAFIPEGNLTNGDFAKWKERKAMYDVYSALNASGSLETYATALSTAKAVYDNVEATVDQLRAATRALIVATAYGIESSTNVSALFTNADMQQFGTSDWSATGVARSGGAIEVYHGAITLTQTKTDLPLGQYTFYFRGMSRQDGSDAAPVFKATSGDNETPANVPFMTDLAAGWNVTSNNNEWSGTNGSRIPDKLWRAAEGLAYEAASAKITNFNVINPSTTLSVTQTSTSQWFIFNSFDIYYNTPILASFASELPASGDMAADTWYYVDVPSNSEYDLTATTLANIVYTTDGTVVKANMGSVSETFSSTNPIALTAGRYYIKSSSANNFAFEAHTKTYTVGDVTGTSIADNTYQQSLTTVTFTLGDAASNDGTAALALQGTPVAKLNDGSSDVADGALSISGNIVTATYTSVTLDPAKTYTITLPANAVAWDKNTENKNTAKVITFKTPAVFDGTFFIATTDGTQFISRGGDSNTEAILDEFGIAATFTTDVDNVTHIQFVDNDKNLFGGSSSIYTDKNESDLGDNAARARWTVASVPGGYSLYCGTWSKFIKAGTGAESGKVAATYDENSYAWTLVAPAAHAATMATYKDANAAAVATAAGLSATTVAALKTTLEANYTPENVNLTNAYSSVAEKYQPSGYTEKIIEQEYSGLSNGIYKVSIFAFHRIKGNADTYACYQNNTDNPTSYLYANDQKIQLPSVMSEPSASAYTGGNNPNYSPASGKNYPNNPTNAGQAFDAGRYKVEVFALVTDGTLKIGLTDPGKYTAATWVYSNWICYRDLKVTKYQPSSESVTVTDAGYATYVSSLPLDYTSTDIKAYTAKADAGKVVLTQINKVPANTPVILYKEDGATEDIPVATSTDTPEPSDLVAGTGEAVATDGGESTTNYILNVVNEKIGFYLANDQTVATNRAYLHVPNSEKGSESRMTIVFDDQATGIADLKAAAKGDAIYNLNGQRIEKATKGIYIIGGKKMMKK